MKFYIGDIITGTKKADAKYFITTSDGTYEVIDDEYGINVRVVSHKYYPDEIGNKYNVNLDFFVLVRRNNGIFGRLFNDESTDENVSDLFLKDSPAQIQLEKEFEEYKKENR